MGLAMEKYDDLDAFMMANNADLGWADLGCADTGWHISFRLAPGVVAKGVDPRTTLAKMGECRVIGRDDVSPAPVGAYQRPTSWDMVLVGDTTRAAIEDVFAGMPDAMELVIEPMF